MAQRQPRKKAKAARAPTVTTEHQVAAAAGAVTVTAAATASGGRRQGSFRSLDKFEGLAGVSDGTRQALKDVFHYERLSVQQAMYMPLMMRPDAPDVFVKAGTGSGKTLGFLIPAIEALLLPDGRGEQRGKSEREKTEDKTRKKRKSAGPCVRVLVLSPTRELAAQTAQEATRLLTFHPGRTAGVVTGGTDRGKDLARMTASPPDVLVATPGRLHDLVDALPGLLSHVRVAVLDEADRLLDPGFAPEVRQILATLPVARRTLLLTATVPPEVKGVATTFMRAGFAYVDASGAVVGHNNNVGVLQRAVMCQPRDVHFEVARALYMHHAALHARAKVLVFFSSIALAEVYSALFRARPQPAWAGLLELHGGLAQNKRTRAMDAFRSSPGGVLFASDAAGRGIDIPNVTLVVQVGCAPADVYQQRVGRTGRAGAKGEAVILLGRDEQRALAPLRVVAPGLQVQEAQAVGASDRAAFQVSPSAQDQRLAEKAFKGALGAYKASAKALGWQPQGVVDAVAARVMGMGMVTVPDIPDKTLAKMGLRGVSFDTAAIVGRTSVPEESTAVVPYVAARLPPQQQQQQQQQQHDGRPKSTAQEVVKPPSRNGNNKRGRNVTSHAVDEGSRYNATRDAKRAARVPKKVLGDKRVRPASNASSHSHSHGHGKGRAVKRATEE